MLYIACFVCGFLAAALIYTREKKTKVYRVDNIKEIGNAKIHIDDNSNDNIFK